MATRKSPDVIAAERQAAIPARTSASRGNVAIVSIGRNEGARLERCLRSCRASGCPVIYVDSSSSDGSVECALKLGIEVVLLDDDERALTPARARNAGYKRLRHLLPGSGFVQFVDGDCELDSAWIDTACAALDSTPQAAVVCGRLSERDPETSIYKRICQVEWDAPLGFVPTCGGIFMVRVDIFDRFGGFEPQLRAGEEPEFCRRLVDSGFRILRLDRPMAVHDAAMLTFGDWWRRTVQHADTDMAALCARGLEAYRRTMWSIWLWTLGWPAAVLIVLLLAWSLAGLQLAIPATCAVILAFPAQIGRIARRTHRAGHDALTALTYATLIMVGKWAQLWGRVRFHCRRWKHVGARPALHRASTSQQPPPSSGRLPVRTWEDT